MPKRTAKKYGMELPCQTENLELIRDFVADVARKSGFNEENINKIELAVDEACTNVVKHAYDREVKCKIKLDIQVNNQEFTIKVKDTGKGFDPEQLEDIDMSKYMKEFRTGGLGIHLMRTLMDEVKYNIKPGKSNQVVMTKYLKK